VPSRLGVNFPSGPLSSEDLTLASFDIRKCT